MTPAVEEPYACPDIVFVLDSSNSLSWSDWHHQLAMVNQVVKRLEKVSNNLSWSDGHNQLAMVNQVVKQLEKVNKAVYTATLVACRWAGAGRKLTNHAVGQEQ